MNSNQLLKRDGSLIRVLDTAGDKAFIIDCRRRTMPKWVETEQLTAYTPCSEGSSMQAKIDLANHIGVIAAETGGQGDSSIKDIRKNRRREQSKTHIDHVRRGGK